MYQQLPWNLHHLRFLTRFAPTKILRSLNTKKFYCIKAKQIVTNSILVEVSQFFNIFFNEIDTETDVNRCEVKMKSATDMCFLKSDNLIDDPNKIDGKHTRFSRAGNLWFIIAFGSAGICVW